MNLDAIWNSITSARLESPAWIHAVWLGVIAALLAFWAARRALRAIRRFTSDDLVRELAPGSSIVRRTIKGVLLGAAVALVAVAVARPQHTPERRAVETRGREVVFLVDVSRSMLARDLAPSRLGRAKLWINDLARSLKGDRVAIVAFAGTARVVCPLTTDQGFFELALDELGPNSVDRGGTLIGDAVRKTLDVVFAIDRDDANDFAGVRDIILVTDGEDQESLPVQAAGRAAEAGVRIIALGIGSRGEGAPVPTAADESDTVTFNGQQVRSALNEDALADIATATPGGAFIPVGTGEIDLAAEFRRLTANNESRVFDQVERVRYREAYQWFLGLALVSLAIERLVPATRRTGR